VLVTFIVVSGLVVSRSNCGCTSFLPLVNQGESVPVPFLEYGLLSHIHTPGRPLVGVLLAATRLFRPRPVGAHHCARGSVVCSRNPRPDKEAFVICQDMFSFATALVGYPLLALGFGLLVSGEPEQRRLAREVSDRGVRRLLRHSHIAPISPTKRSCIWTGSIWATRSIDRYDRSGGLSLSFVVAAWILHICIERPFLRLRDRRLGILLKTSEVPD